MFFEISRTSSFFSKMQTCEKKSFIDFLNKKSRLFHPKIVIKVVQVIVVLCIYNLLPNGKYLLEKWVQNNFFRKCKFFQLIVNIFMSIGINLFLTKFWCDESHGYPNWDFGLWTYRNQFLTGKFLDCVYGGFKQLGISIGFGESNQIKRINWMYDGKIFRVRLLYLRYLRKYWYVSSSNR